MIAFILLSLSILLSTGRNLLSKNLSAVSFGTKDFFLRQAFLFLCGTAALAILGGTSIGMPSAETVIYAVIYAALLVFAQWFYTAALDGGNTALCSTVYSMGFILPTLSGSVFFGEQFSLPDVFGILCASLAVIISGYSRQGKRTQEGRYFLPLLIAMLASGGLGIMQKVQQRSDSADEKTVFLIIAFIIAALISLAVYFAAGKREPEKPDRKTFLFSAGIGAAFGSCNLLNTALAGLLPSAIFFPSLNIGVILITMLCGIILFKERPGKRELLVLGFGALAILLLNI